MPRLDWEPTAEELFEEAFSGYACDDCGKPTSKLVELEDVLLLICPACAMKRLAQHDGLRAG